MSDSNEQPLRYSDRPTTAARVEIAGPISDVWDLVSDVELPCRFSSEVLEVRLLDGAGSAKLGTRFVGRNRHEAIGEWEAPCTVTAFDPGQVFEWSVGEPGEPWSVWRFELAGIDGAVELVQTFQIGPARSGLNAAIDSMPDKESRIIERRLAEHRVNMQANLDGVKSIVEGTGGQ